MDRRRPWLALPATPFHAASRRSRRTPAKARHPRGREDPEAGTRPAARPGPVPETRGLPCPAAVSASLTPCRVTGQRLAPARVEQTPLRGRRPCPREETGRYTRAGEEPKPCCPT